MSGKYLRAVSSTRHSITITWDSETIYVNRACEKWFQEEEGTSPRSFVLQIKNKILGWTTVYSGYKTEVEITSLKPGDCFQFRVRIGGESEWSGTLYAATKDEPIPLSQLFRAVQNSHPGNTKKIITQRPSILNTPNKFSQSPLELAVSNNDLNMVNLLLNNGADYSRTETGSWRTPLMIACFRGHLELAKLLVEKGFSWIDKDRNGLRALHYAADNSHLDIVKFAVEDGADVNAKDKYGWTPLMRAVTLKASPEVIEYLLENGSDANGTDNHNQTVLMQAVISGRSDIVRIIASKNPDLTVRNEYGRTAYDMALASPVKEVRKIAFTIAVTTESGQKKPAKI